MEFFKVSLESHRHAATLYVAGLLAERAATNVDVVVRGLAADVRVLRVDLSAVMLIDPAAFVLVVRALNNWRDEGRRQVRIEFPRRSRRASSAELLSRSVAPSQVVLPCPAAPPRSPYASPSPSGPSPH